MTDQNKAIEAVIKQAIKGEEDAYALYTSAAKVVKATEAKTMLSDMAKDELGHKSRLEGLLRQGISWNIADGAFKRVTDLKVGDHLAAKPLEDGADLQAVLMFGIQREKESHELYTTMGGLTGDATVRNLFEFLANEELTHKRKLETLYEEVIYKHF
jgi:rubrerythrin